MEAERPVREITRHLKRDRQKMMAPKGALDGYEYCWVYCEKHSLDVDQALFDGWEVVKGNMPEAQDKKAEDGTRRFADTLLMRITKENREILRQEKEELDERYSGRSHDQEIIERINQKGGKGFDFRDLEELRKFIGR